MFSYFLQLVLTSCNLVSGYNSDLLPTTLKDVPYKKPTITAAAQHDVLERALSDMETMPTISLRPLFDYIPTSSISLLDPIDATGLNITIFTLENQDVGIVISPDLLNNLQRNMHDSCTNQTAEKCSDAIKHTLHNPQVDLERRFFGIDDGIGLLVGAASSVLVSVLAELWMAGRTLSPTIRIPQQDIAQATAVAMEMDYATTPATAVVIGPSGFRETVSHYSTPIPSSGSLPSISTLSEDAFGGKKGQVLLTLPQTLADRLNEMILNSNATCPAKRDLSSPDLELGCTIATAETLLDNMRPGYALDTLLSFGRGLLDEFWMNFYPRIQPAIDEVNLYAKDLAPELGIPVEVAGELALLCVLLTTAVIQTGRLVKPLNFLDTGIPPKIPPSVPAVSTSTKSCTRTPGCAEPSCNDEFYAASCTMGEFSGCACTMTGCQLHVPNATDVAWLLAQAQSLMSQNNGSTTTTTPQGLCTFTDAGPGFKNSIRATPNQWCVCTPTSQTTQTFDSSLLRDFSKLFPTPTVGTFSVTQTYETITSKSGVEACAYTDVPTATLNVTWGTPITSVTDCSMVMTSAGDQIIDAPYCTCNDEGKYSRDWQWDTVSSNYLPVCTYLPRKPRLPLNGNMIVAATFQNTTKSDLSWSVMRTMPKRNWTEVDPCSWAYDRVGVPDDGATGAITSSGMLILSIPAFGATPAFTNCTLSSHETSANTFLTCLGYERLLCASLNDKLDIKNCPYAAANYALISACTDPVF